VHKAPQDHQGQQVWPDLLGALGIQGIPAIRETPGILVYQGLKEYRGNKVSKGRPVRTEIAVFGVQLGHKEYKVLRANQVRIFPITCRP
jgi:hypothetical protein